MSNSPYVEVLNKIIAELQAVIDSSDTKAEIKPMLTNKINIIKMKVLPVATKKVLTEQDVIDAESITCYGLAYCCGIKRNDGPGKVCYWRDAARAALHIDDDLYVQKEVVVWQLLAATERSEEWIEEKAANLPTLQRE